MLGASGVGKTCLLQRYISNTFSDCESTIGASLAMRKWGNLNVALWDTAGEEKYASLSAFYCRGASVAIVVYDVTDAASLDKLQEVFIPLLKGAGQSCLPVVVGAKCDLLGEKSRQVTKQQGQELAEQLHAKQLEKAQVGGASTFLSAVTPKKSFFETSAKTGENVTELFEYIEGVVVKQSTTFKPDPDVVKLDKQSSSGGGGGASQKGCCK